MFEALMKKMDSQKQDTDEKLQSLESVVKHLQQRATTTDANLGNLQAQFNNRLPPQPLANPKVNVSAIDACLVFTIFVTASARVM